MDKQEAGRLAKTVNATASYQVVGTRHYGHSRQTGYYALDVRDVYTGLTKVIYNAEEWAEAQEQLARMRRALEVGE